MPSSETKYVYDGWNMIELNAGIATLRSYVGGIDLSRPKTGVGGVRGLVGVKTSAGHFATYDGNGNMVELVDASSGASSAQYEYDPAGEVIRITGTVNAAGNPFRFSTKFTDGDADFIYCYRYYNPSIGRWLSRDPIGYQGGVNLYAMSRMEPRPGSIQLG